MNSYLICITKDDNIPEAVFVTEEELGTLLTNLDRTTYQIADMMPVTAFKVTDYKVFCKPSNGLEVGTDEKA